MRVPFVVWLLVASAAACGASTPRSATPAQVESTRADVLAIRAAARRWIAEKVPEPLEVAGSHPPEEYCPTIGDLKKAKLLAPDARERDPWGHTYRVHCGVGLYFVFSVGPDGAAGTSDDITSGE